MPLKYPKATKFCHLKKKNPPSLEKSELESDEWCETPGEKNSETSGRGRCKELLVFGQNYETVVEREKK